MTERKRGKPERKSKPIEVENKVLSKMLVDAGLGQKLLIPQEADFEKYANLVEVRNVPPHKKADDVLGVFMATSTPEELLDEEDERFLARNVQTARVLTAFLREEEDYKDINNPRFIQLAVEKQERDNREIGNLGSEDVLSLLKYGSGAADLLTRANTRLVISIAKGYKGQGLELSDLVQEGAPGLLKASLGYNPYLYDTKFGTYATHAIRREIKRAIANKGSTIRIPRHIRDRIKELKGLEDELAQELLRTPKDGELAVNFFDRLADLRDPDKELNREDKKRIRLHERKLRSLRMLGSGAVSLEGPVNEEGEELGVFIEDPEQDTSGSVISNLEQEYLKEVLQAALEELNEKERKIIKLSFGINGEKPLGPEEVAERMGISTRKLGEWKAKAMRKLKKPGGPLWEFRDAGS